MELLSLLIALLLSTAGAAAKQPTAMTPADAAREAEHFIARHGYTADGHPADQPVERASLYDVIYDAKDLVVRRKGTMSAKATCVRTHSSHNQTVLFQSTDNLEEYWFVSLPVEGRPYVGHQTVRRSADCVPVTGAVP